MIDKNISISLPVIKLYLLKSNRKNIEMTKNNSCCHFLDGKKNGVYTDTLNHILWVRRVFDFIVDADSRTLKYLTAIPYLKISLVKLIILCLKAILDHYPCSLAQYIFDIDWIKYKYLCYLEMNNWFYNTIWLDFLSVFD